MCLQLIPQFSCHDGSSAGAGILGLHLEGPFISQEKRGAHPLQCILPFEHGFKDIMNVYGNLDKVSLVTVAPELENAMAVIQELKQRNVTVSIGNATIDCIACTSITCTCMYMIVQLPLSQQFYFMTNHANSICTGDNLRSVKLCI